MSQTVSHQVVPQFSKLEWTILFGLVLPSGSEMSQISPKKQETHDYKHAPVTGPDF